jgi:hypothetical protein
VNATPVSVERIGSLTPEELYALLGHDDVTRDVDIKTMVLDIVRERMTDDEVQTIFWRYLIELDERFIKDYLYRRNY